MLNRKQLKHKIFMCMARDIASLSTCSRRQVGCIITDAHGVVIGSGFNGSMSGQPHCVETNPKGDKEKCFCLHAEVNAIMNADTTRTYRTGNDYTAYVTTFPCDSCMKLLVAFGVTTVVYDTQYRYFESSLRVAKYYGVEVLDAQNYMERKDV